MFECIQLPFCSDTYLLECCNVMIPTSFQLLTTVALSKHVTAIFLTVFDYLTVHHNVNVQ